MNPGTSLALQNVQLPAHLASITQEQLDESAKAAQGIKSISFPRIGIKGGKFHVVKEGQHILVTDPDKPGLNLPLMMLEVVIVAWNPYVSKTYYEGEYGEDHEGDEPDCRSDDGIAPDSDVSQPVSPRCADCKMNVWGSKVSKKTGKDVKACADGKRVVVLPSKALEKSEAYALMITPAALKGWKKYVDILTSKQIPIYAVVTNVTFDPTADFPRLMFNFGRFLDQAELATVLARRETEEVKNIAQLRPVTSQRIIAGPAPLKTAAQELGEQAAKTVDTIKQNTANIVTSQADLGRAAAAAATARNAEMKAQLDAARVAETAAPETGFSLGDAVQAKTTTPAPVTVQWSDGVPQTIVDAVKMVGGHESVAGQSILAAHKLMLGGKAAEEPAKPRRTRAVKAVEVPAATAGLTTTAQPAPVVQPTGFSTAPAANVATPGAVDQDLTAMINQAMNTQV